MENFLQDFPVVIEIPLHWGEMDAFAHLNNTVYFRYFESARIAYFEKIKYIDVMKSTGVGPILASTCCKFKFPLRYPDRVWVGARVVKIEADRFHMVYRIVSQTHNKIAADGEGLIVSYNYNENQKAILPDEIKQNILQLENRGAKKC
ncbi:MAG: acyl-CoA thioesterase [Calditrichaeota bacterium]|nr:MAG: acyl-CoA thioesterase [Calditrichota bacterium]